MGILNTIVCEDIRDEIGNKKSLIGVFAGDIVVPSFPTVVRIAFYLEYKPAPDEADRVVFSFRLLLDDTEFAKGTGFIPFVKTESGVAAIPQALLTIDKEVRLRMLISKNKGPEEEMVSKRVSQDPAASSSAPAPPSCNFTSPLRH